MMGVVAVGLGRAKKVQTYPDFCTIGDRFFKQIETTQL